MPPPSFFSSQGVATGHLSPTLNTTLREVNTHTLWEIKIQFRSTIPPKQFSLSTAFSPTCLQKQRRFAHNVHRLIHRSVCVGEAGFLGWQ
jgi:hypothetical protein